MKLIKDLLEADGGGTKVLSIELDVIADIGNKHYVVADQSKELILLDLSQEGAGEVKENDKIKLIKPKITGVSPKVLSPTTMKAVRIGTVNEKQKVKYDLSKYVDYANNLKKVDGLTFDDTEKYEPKTSIPEILVFTTQISRKIEGSYGPYQIATIKDLKGNTGTLNLYGARVGEMEPGQAYTLKKLTKSNIKKEEDDFSRLTIKYGTVIKGNNEKFENVKLGEHKFEGQVIGVVDIKEKQICKHDKEVVNEDSHCQTCGKKDTIVKLQANIYVETSDDVVDVKIEDWVLKNTKPGDSNSDKWLEEQLMSKKVKIEANKGYGGTDLWAVKLSYQVEPKIKKEAHKDVPVNDSKGKAKPKEK